MHFRISDTFTDSLAQLTNEEQKAVKTTAFDLQMNPANPGMQFHKLDKVKDDRFWSVRVNKDIRLIVHKSESSLLLCYVDHHDQAYRWAESRKVETHPKTGAAQLVKVKETVREIAIPKYVAEEPARKTLFDDVSDEQLLGYGVPEDWLEDVRQVDEDHFLELADHLPGEAAEALLKRAVGETPEAAPSIEEEKDPFEHPDAQRRFRVMHNVEELERALNYPWEKWMVFLHPAQRQLVEKDFNGPARISGSAGTGKTIVALHRSVSLARNHPHARILLTTFSDTLADLLRHKLRILISNEPQLAERIEVHAVNAIGHRLYELNMGALRLALRERIKTLLKEASSTAGEHPFSLRFLLNEWEQVVDARQIRSWPEYREVRRLGRKTRLPESRRKLLWQVFEKVLIGLKENKQLTPAEMFHELARKFDGHNHTPFDYVIVDEAQDVSIGQLKFLSSLGTDAPNRLFFTGDLGQRIFQQPFSWKSLDIDIRGRAHILKINYRTSHQIRLQADRLLGNEVTDVDGITEDRQGTVSVFNGPKPMIRVFENEGIETDHVVQWINDCIAGGIEPREIGVFVRSTKELGRAEQAVDKTGFKFKVFDEQAMPEKGCISVGTMHRAKGLEFRAVAVMACDDEVLPLQERIETVSDDNELEEVYNTERHLLYVASTRARDRLLVTGVEPGSEFLEDMTPKIGGKPVV